MLTLWAVAAWAAGNVTVRAVNRPVTEVFGIIMRQTGKNFVYPSNLLRDMRVSVDLRDVDLREALDVIFEGTGVEYKIRGRDVMLKRQPRKKPAKVKETPAPVAARPAEAPDTLGENMLKEVVVVSRLNDAHTETAEVGAVKVTPDQIYGTPTIFGESDIMKTLQLQAGVSAGTDGTAEMHVHGGGSDENLFLLDNVPLYHVCHVGGLFSAFNSDAVRYVDFYKSSIPAKYDGRLSSVMDVRTRTGIPDRVHGAFRIGLTSGALNINGPIGKNTAYFFSLRRSWFDLVTYPACKLFLNNPGEQIMFQYFFMDLNAKIYHRFSENTNAFVSVYHGKDLFGFSLDQQEDASDLHGAYTYQWGNYVAQAGVNHRFGNGMTAEFTGAFTRFFTESDVDIKANEWDLNTPDDKFTTTLRNTKKSHMDDYTARADFRIADPDAGSNLRFGGYTTLHKFMPAYNRLRFEVGPYQLASADSCLRLFATELGAYVEKEWRPVESVIANVGVSGSTFIVGGRWKWGLSPRLSANWQFAPDWALKGAFTRTTQYVHLMTQSYLSLPSDQWVPVTGDLRPQTANKLSMGLYYDTPSRQYSFGIEPYYKDMRNIIEFRDEYYLAPPADIWRSQLCSGSGTAKGIDFTAERNFGRIRGHVAYSLAWTDRKFAEKNAGLRYPARFDNRHTIHALVNFDLTDRLTFNAAWTGHSGNRFTLSMQTWDGPQPDENNNYYLGASADVRTQLNNCSMPFYHRLDLSLAYKTRRGVWDLSVYNTYNHRNVIAILGFWDGKPEMLKFLPIIPSISYTWKF